MAPPATPLNRRTVLGYLAGAIGLSGLGVLPGCGGGSKSEQAGTGGGDGDATRFLLPFFAAGVNEPPILRAGRPERMPFGLGDAEAVPLEDPPEKLSFELLLGGKPIGAPVELTRRDQGVPRPFYSLVTTFDQPGLYTVRTVGTVVAEADFQVAAPADVTLLGIGDAAPSLATPILGDPQGVDPICTRNPVCPFHSISLDKAIVSGTPTALLVSTPAFCQTASCGPVLEFLVDAVAGRDLNVIHAEPYADAAAKQGDILQASPAAIVAATGLTFEPALFAIGADGKVQDWLGFVWDAKETSNLLERLAPKK